MDGNNFKFIKVRPEKCLREKELKCKFPRKIQKLVNVMPIDFLPLRLIMMMAHSINYRYLNETFKYLNYFIVY